MKLLIDVDTGIDDALALLYACASPEADILAVTCVAGNVAARQVAQNTLRVLELAGRPDIEVALGREVPLVRQLVLAPETHGPEGIGYATLPPPGSALSVRHAADLITAEAHRAPGEVTLITTGPLTNLAVALLREPELPRLLRRLVMMAGAYRSAGNTGPTSEWNVAVDPEALQVVLAGWAAVGDAPRPVALGLDVTELAKLTPDHLARLHAAAGNPPANPVLNFIDDALAVAATLDPELIKVESLAVEVELGGTLTTGETVADWRRQWNRPPNLDVAVDARVATFFERFIERVGRLAAEFPNVST